MLHQTRIKRNKVAMTCELTLHYGILCLSYSTLLSSSYILVYTYTWEYMFQNTFRYTTKYILSHTHTHSYERPHDDEVMKMMMAVL